MQDILLNEELELIVKNGDFVVKESTYQHQKLLLICEKGELKASPKVGIGSYRYLENENPQNYAREIRQEFTNDGMLVNKIEFNQNASINIDAQYK